MSFAENVAYIMSRRSALQAPVNTLKLLQASAIAKTETDVCFSLSLWNSKDHADVPYQEEHHLKH